MENSNNKQEDGPGFGGISFDSDRLCWVLDGGKEFIIIIINVFIYSRLKVHQIKLIWPNDGTAQTISKRMSQALVRYHLIVTSYAWYWVVVKTHILTFIITNVFIVGQKYLNFY